MAARDYGQYGGTARALELVGERWALLIVRDLLVGPRRYGELSAGLPRIPTNVLATRLKELQAAGVIRRAPRSRVIIYELTEYGRELEPIVLALGAWGFRALGEPRDDQVITPESMTIDLRSAFQSSAAALLPPTSYSAHVGSADLVLRVDGPALAVDAGSGPADIRFEADAGIRRLITGDVSADAALRAGIVRVIEGDRSLIHRFAETFRIAA
ncbi:DNA-binding HxlR family transcriptional regulator [Microbacteriaceae bacterium SG_E_30_P1]|uniref:DNA-binding HxlR family transcriptional regulator n=1 Tax=Antiquaquibacter oligotrophicus TaxID=2880260 RepID=A0ABT6KQI7_9MICO|nr:winged helix-turn-helix transcriptional regulator [Antiquaquibacter oligotrophicus]MDH6182104.1 DNA-binding HxlR family transcriptional regulator [Antiquaquibacter oligotrophicus]UDF12232.1 winged helix-turn-helix transcriptional regulator [Antiquaquibacter oligotrophicus]